MANDDDDDDFDGVLVERARATQNSSQFVFVAQNDSTIVIDLFIRNN